MKPQYLDWLIQEQPVTTSEGKQIIVYELVIQDDENILNAWANIYANIIVLIMK
jgi:ABC-type thiamine transport system substrate-binding protein